MNGKMTFQSWMTGRMIIPFINKKKSFGEKGKMINLTSDMLV
jgi:hypothetical protein